MFYLLSMQTGNGKTLTTVNGKTYILLRHHVFGNTGSFFFVVSGAVPLKPDDIDEHWRVIRNHNLYVAFAARYFSYHLLKGEDATCPIEGWPKFKTEPDYYAFIAPTEQAIHTQIKLVIQEYRPRVIHKLPDIIANAYKIKDHPTNGKPYAYLVRKEDLE